MASKKKQNKCMTFKALDLVRGALDGGFVKCEKGLWHEFKKKSK
jgi:hypothetical protein